MKLHVNGVERELDEGCTIAALLAALGLTRDGVAVARNGAVVPRGEHASTALKAGDRVEVIMAVGGG